MSSQIWSLSTSESEPLILKEPRVMVTIDGKKHKDIVCYRNVAEFVKFASEKANTKLYRSVDQHGSQVTDLSTFILNKPKESTFIFSESQTRQPKLPSFFVNFT